MKKTYECYSYYMMKYLLENKVVPIGVKVHRKTDKTFWQYEINDELSELLTAWTNKKTK